MSRRPAKVENVIEIVKAAIASRQFRISAHAAKRMEERDITSPDLIQVLAAGYHEARKDEFKEEYSSWSYAIRGKTVDARNLRFAVAIEAPGFVVVTAIDLDREEV